jgi:GDP-L-fucose synthase
MSPQPIKEEYLLTGPLEPTNEAYALAKIAGLKLVEAYKRQYGHDWISAMPTNLYGPGDNYDLENSHVLPALIRKFHEAKKNGKREVNLWGSGEPLREFLHSDDLAVACLHLLSSYSGSTALNIGSGSEVSIKELALTVSQIVGFDGEILWNSSMPDGTPRKLLDITKLLETGWVPQISLEDGIRSVYEDCNTKDWY